MNKKLFLISSFVAISLAAGSIYSATYASNDDDDFDDDKAERSEVRKDYNDKKKELQKSMNEEKKELRASFFAQLDTTTQENIKALYDTYKPKLLAIKEDDTTTDEEKKIALKALHEELKNETRVLIPTDLQDEFDALEGEIMEIHDAWKTQRDDLKEDWKNTKEERKAKRQERREKMKGKFRVVFGKLDNLLVRFEANKPVDDLVIKYTTIGDRIDEKLMSIDETTDLYAFLQSLSDDLKDRIAELQAE